MCSLISRESISISNEAIDALAGWKVYFMHLVDGQWEKIKPVAYVNLNVLLFLAMIIIGAIILQKTRFGRNVYAIGGNEQSAKLMGLPVGRTKVLVYGFNGLCSVLAGVAYVLYVKSGWNLSLQGAELDVISSAVIGGVLLTGGVGYMVGTLFGVLLKSTIPSLITFSGNLSSWVGQDRHRRSAALVHRHPAGGGHLHRQKESGVKQYGLKARQIAWPSAHLEMPAVSSRCFNYAPARKAGSKGNVPLAGVRGQRPRR